MNRRQHIGAWGEAVAAAVLTAHGAQVLARNWRPDTAIPSAQRPRGELDLVLATPRGLVACEVKTRSAAAYGHPFEAIVPEKLRRLRQLAQAWLRETGATGPIRVDAVAVTGSPRSFRWEVLEAVA